MASGSISVPPGAVGSTSWHSGIERPQKRMPSSESRTDGSQSMYLRARGGCEGRGERGLGVKSGGDAGERCREGRRGSLDATATADDLRA